MIVMIDFITNFCLKNKLKYHIISLKLLKEMSNIFQIWYDSFIKKL